jgi:exonuclease SbcD
MTLDFNAADFNPSDFNSSGEKIAVFQKEDKRLTGPALRILHSSDWHLGRSLQKIKRRHEEQAQFLSWLTQVIRDEKIDVLLTAGDVFDTYAPSVPAQELYYTFLRDVIKSSACRNVVISSGNHDSSAFLNAPAKLLRGFDVFVVSDVTDNLEDEVLTLYGKDGEPVLIVAAVPFIKDRHARLSSEGETMGDRDARMEEGVVAHYTEVARLCEERREKLGNSAIPIVGMGHFFATGGSVTEGDGVRELYPGGQSRVRTSLFPESFDYLALGHLHSPQKAGKETFRYCGAPLPMSFNEAKSKKSVTIATLGEGLVDIKLIPIPLFQRLKVIQGDYEDIRAEIRALKKEKVSVWVEVIYTGSDSARELKGPLEDETKDSQVEILSIINKTLSQMVFSPEDSDKKELKEYKPQDVFAKLLMDNGVAEEEWPMLKETFDEIVRSLEIDNPESPGPEAPPLVA